MLIEFCFHIFESEMSADIVSFSKGDARLMKVKNCAVHLKTSIARTSAC